MLDRAGAAAALLLSAALLAAPALWNGYPLIYFDTEDYVNMSFTWDLILWRTMPYAVVTAIGRPFDTLFAVVAVQALAAAWVLQEAVAGFVARRRAPALVGLAAMLAALTGLPWVVSQILPDAFAGPTLLGIATLAFGARRATWRRGALAAVVAVSIAVHMSHVAVAAGLLACLGLSWAASVAWPSAGLPRPRMAAAALAIALGVAITPAVHRVAEGEWFFSRSGRVLQLALFIQNGVAQRYLDEVCPQGAALKLCPYRRELPDNADRFLWWGEFTPFYRLGGWSAMIDEADAIVRGAVARYPGEVAAAAIVNAIEQWGDVDVGEGLTPKRTPGAGGEFFDAAANRYPGEFKAYLKARQQTGDGVDLSLLNRIQRPIALAAPLALLALGAFAWRRGDRDGVGLALVVLLGLLGNAFVCGAISNPHDRYQNRVVWTALAAAALLVARRREERACGVQPV